MAKKMLLAALLAATAPAFAAMPATTQLLETGNGYVRLRSTDPEYLQTFQSEVVAPANALRAQGLSVQQPGRKTAQGTSELTGELVVVNTVRGVLAANFPQWLKQEILEEAGYPDIAALTDAQLNAAISQVSIDMDSLAAVSEEGGAGPNASILSAQEERVQRAGSMYARIGPTVRPLGLCSKKRESKMKDYTFSLDKNYFNPTKTTTGDLTTEFSSGLSGKGSVTGAIHYVAKKRCGVTYGAEFERAEFTLDTLLGGEVSFGAKARYDHTERLFSERFKYELGEYDFWVYFLQFRLAADLQFDIGVDVNLMAAAEVRSSYKIGGFAKMKWTCWSASNCVRTSNDVNLKPAIRETTSYQAQAAVTVTPFIDSSIGAELSLYWGTIDLIGIRAGVLTEVPMKGYAYIGNMCSDADGDGTMEQVRAAFLDVSVQFSGYLKWELLGDDAKMEIDLDMELYGYRKEYRKVVDLHGVSTNKNFYVRNLYFKDLLAGGSSMFQPVVTSPKVTAQNMSIKVSTRSCHALGGDAIYEVDFGAGGPIVRGKAGDLNYLYPRLGDYTVRIRLAGDSQGREFDTAWTTFRINVSPDGKTPYYPWLTTIVLELLE